MVIIKSETTTPITLPHPYWLIMTPPPNEKISEKGVGHITLKIDGKQIGIVFNWEGGGGTFTVDSGQTYLYVALITKLPF